MKGKVKHRIKNSNTSDEVKKVNEINFIAERSLSAESNMTQRVGVEEKKGWADDNEK